MSQPAATSSPETRESAHPALELPPVCARIDEEVPSVREGVARLRAIADHLEDVDERTSEEIHTQMRKVAEGAAEEGASDLELGGPATRGEVWYRVDGEKGPREGFGRQSVGELDVFLLALLSRRQREQLLEEFSLDFSFAIELPGEDRPQRFRGTMYLENGHLALNMRLIENDLRPLESLGFHPNIQRGMLSPW